MNSLFLPKLSGSSKEMVSEFRSFSFQPATVAYSGFYYVGRQADHIEKLVHVYGRGYASEGLKNVKAELIRSLEQEKDRLPEAIVCEARFDITVIRAFCQFLRSHPVLKAVPFVLDGSGLSAEELMLYKKQTRPDEILFLDTCTADELKQKIRFLHRVKASYTRHQAFPVIEEQSKMPFISFGRATKRGFDILVASVAILLLSPLFFLVALAVRLESRGPIFYIAKRAGRGYKIFNFYKFRTMVVNADKKMKELSALNQYDASSAGPVFFKISNDPRITRVGGFLRNTSLDELPQLFNVLLGDMSLVGNRPLPLYEAETLTTDDYAARFLAPAGITGLWQVKKRGNKDMSVEERINLDIDYASKCNFATDFWIIANTPSALLQKENV
jgi:lipopolysaccharide/colanic/teichoic acid biosynthesis glycosyltransferase